MYVCYYSTWGIYFPPLNVPFINWAGGMNAWHQCYLGNVGSLTSIKERLSAQANHQMKLKAIADTVILCWQEHSIIANTQQVQKPTFKLSVGMSLTLITRVYNITCSIQMQSWSFAEEYGSKQCLVRGATYKLPSEPQKNRGSSCTFDVLDCLDLA